MSVPRTQSLRRALELLQAVERSDNRGSTADLARSTGLPPATALRLLVTLEDAGFASRGSVGWRIGPELQRLARRADPHRALARRARPILEQLAADAGESAMLAVPLPGPEVDVIAQADGARLLGITNWVGRSIALHASAAGKLVLADLEDRELSAWFTRHRLARLTPATLVTPDALRAELQRVRNRGWAEIDEESEPGLASIALAIRDHANTLTGIIGISGPRDRFDRLALLTPLRRAVDALR